MTTLTKEYKPKIQERMANTTNGGKRAATARLVEMIGKLDDRHKRALTAGDKQALLELAGEYMTLNCLNLANQITMEATNL